jgi:hypothetical protein
MSLPKTKPAWLMLAIASGGCAAVNGVFAKLYDSLTSHLVLAANKSHSTTTELTTSWSSYVSTTLGLDRENQLVEYAIRGVRP